MSVVGPEGASKPQYFTDPGVDALYQMVLVLGEELACAQEQIHALVQILASGETPTPAALDEFKPDATYDQARAAYVQRLLDPLKGLVERETRG